MNDTKIASKPRGRPRAFDVDAALDTAQALFHERGYDAVSVATLTEVLGISPPSFYAAFGSKAALFDQVLARYSAAALPIDAIIRPDRDVPEALGELLVAAANIYAADPRLTGCLVLESARATPDESCTASARQHSVASHEFIHAFIAAANPDQADRLTDFFDVTLSGLSARSREGWTSDRLVAVAQMAAEAITRAWEP